MVEHHREGGSSMNGTTFVLPTPTWLNPAAPETGEFYDPRQVAFVLFKMNENRTRPTRVVTSFGGYDASQVGDVWELRHDQTDAYLGDYKVVGIVDFTTGAKHGEVPNRPIKLAVAK
jgi:hypothetical protein